MPSIANFSASIQVDGHALSEYEITYTEDGKRAACWIPSEISRQFAICVSNYERDYPSATTVYVDGIRCHGKIMYGKATHPRRSPVSTQYGVKVSDKSYRPFVFSKCDLMEDEDAKNIEDPTSSELGSVMVVVNEVKTRHHVNARYNLQELPPLQVSEKLKKGIVHGTQLGAEVLSRTKRPRTSSKIRCVATFVFHYRPLEVLQAAGLAPGPIDLDDHRPFSTTPNEAAKKEEDRPQTLSDVKIEVKSEDVSDLLLLT